MIFWKERTGLVSFLFVAIILEKKQPDNFTVITIKFLAAAIKIKSGLVLRRFLVKNAASLGGYF